MRFRNHARANDILKAATSFKLVLHDGTQLWKVCATWAPSVNKPIVLNRSNPDVYVAEPKKSDTKVHMFKIRS